MEGNFMMEELACKNPEIRNYPWNLAEERMPSKEAFL